MHPLKLCLGISIPAKLYWVNNTSVQQVIKNWHRNCISIFPWYFTPQTMDREYNIAEDGSQCNTMIIDQCRMFFWTPSTWTSLLCVVSIVATLLPIQIFNICGTIKTTCQLSPAENISQDVFCIKWRDVSATWWILSWNILHMESSTTTHVRETKSSILKC